MTAAAGSNLPAMLVEMISGKQPEQKKPQVGAMMIRYAKETVIDLQTFESMAMAGSYQARVGQQGDKDE